MRFPNLRLQNYRLEELRQDLFLVLDVFCLALRPDDCLFGEFLYFILWEFNLEVFSNFSEFLESFVDTDFLISVDHFQDVDEVLFEALVHSSHGAIGSYHNIILKDRILAFKCLNPERCYMLLPFFTLMNHVSY